MAKTPQMERKANLAKCLKQVNPEERAEVKKYIHDNVVTPGILFKTYLVVPFTRTRYDDDLYLINPNNVTMPVSTLYEAQQILTAHYRDADEEYPAGCFVFDLDNGVLVDYYEESVIRWGTPEQPRGAPPPIE